MKQLKEYDDNSVDPRSSTASDGPFTPGLKGSRRFELPNTILNKGSYIRPSARGSILDDDDTTLDQQDKIISKPAPHEPIEMLPPHDKNLKKQKMRTPTPVVIAKKDSHQVLRDFIRQQLKAVNIS